jgi:RNA polymerase sigma factor (sigma-70 family)
MVSRDDMYQDAWESCLKGLSNYNDMQWSPKTYFAYCASGGIIDAIRRYSPLTRTSFKFKKEMELALVSLCQLRNVDPGDIEDTDIAKTMGISLDLYRSRLNALLTQRGLDTSSSDIDLVGCYGDQDTALLLHEVIEEIDRLPENMKVPMRLVFVDGLDQIEAADRMNKTESVVSTAIQAAVHRLRLKFGVE